MSLSKLTNNNINPSNQEGALIVRAELFNPVVDIVNGLTDGTVELAQLTISSGIIVGDDTPEINAPSGVITTAVTANAPRTVKTVTLTNSYIVTTSKIFATISDYGGTGVPIIYQVTPGNGSAVIQILNNAETGGANLSAAMDIMFLVIN